MEDEHMTPEASSIIVAGRGTRAEVFSVKPIAQMSYKELRVQRSDKTLRRDPERKDQVDSRMSLLVSRAGEMGLFDEIDGAAADALKNSNDLTEAAAAFGKSRQGVMEALRARGYGTDLDIDGIAEQDFQDTHQRMAIKSEADPKKKKSLEAKLRKTQVRSKVDLPWDQLGIEANQKQDPETPRARGEFLNLPESAKDQLLLMRDYLDRIEGSNRDASDYAISQLFAQIEALKPHMDPEVRREVVCRLALHDSSELIRQANGWIEPPPNVGVRFGIGFAFGEATRRGHNITDDNISLLLKEDWSSKVATEGSVVAMQGYDVSMAWNLLQLSNHQYKRIVEKANDFRETNGLGRIEEAGYVMYDADPQQGRVATNFFNDPNVERKSAVREYMVKLLESRHTVVDRASAEKSLQLAEKLSISTLETSVFNRSSAIGNDQLAECLGLMEWRKRRASPGRNRGPMIHEEAIEGFGNSWIRLLRSDGSSELDNMILSKDVDPKLVYKNNWEAYGTVNVNRYWEMKKLLMDRTPKPGSINRSFLQGAVAHFNTCDPATMEAGRVKEKDPKNLRLWWVAGLVDVALAEKELGWTIDDFIHLRDVSTHQQLGDEGTFVTEDMWEWILTATNFSSRVTATQMKRYTASILQSRR